MKVTGEMRELQCEIGVQVWKRPPSIGEKKNDRECSPCVEPCGMGGILPGRNGGEACQVEKQHA